MAGRKRDVVEHSSFSNFQDVKIMSSDYDMCVNLETKEIETYAHIVIRGVNATSVLELDTRGLNIVSITYNPPASNAASTNEQAPSTALEYTLAEAHPFLGSKLSVTLPEQLNAGGETSVEIHFKVDQTSSALQFLSPAQTAGGQHPYLFTQCQAIHARSFVPCQDTPNVKMTYTARVTVNQPLTALMSAKTIEAGQSGFPDSRFAGSLSGPVQTFAFEQSLPIPSYLIALAVGNLESRVLGPISRVWSEPEVIESAAYEFAETTKFLDAGIELAGEYMWGQYDLLLLPPSFPYGGMENPCLTFVTPTLLTGDRSATNVVAHEIAHSWTGNLVTNATWEHFWLNEGWTRFLERRILGRLYGKQTEQLHAATGYVQLQGAVRLYGDNHGFTALVPDLSGDSDPDDAFSQIPYEKGYYFIYYLENLVGGPEAFEPFLKAYIQHFKLKTVTSDEFKDFFLSSFSECPAVSEIDWDTWYYAPGMPPPTNVYDTTLAKAATDLAARWHTADILRLGVAVPEGASKDDIKDWTFDQLDAFLCQLAEYAVASKLHKNTTRRLGTLYGLDAMKNPDVRCVWLKICIGAEDETAIPGACAFLTEQGRMKFLRPLYRALMSSKMGRETATTLFQKVRGSYHPIAEKMVASDLNI